MKKTPIRIRWTKGSGGLTAQWTIPPASTARLAKGVRR